MNTKLNKTDYILLTIVYGISSLLNCWEYYRGDYMPIEYLVDIPITVLISFCTIVVFLYWLIPKYILEKKNYLLFVVFGLCSLSILGMISYTSGFWSAGDDWSKFPRWDFLILQGIFISSGDVGLALGILLTKKLYEGQMRLVTIQKKQKENELKILRSQLDPHFLFNNLNTLDALIDSNPQKAKEYINRLALIYRYLIHTKDSEIMELSEELTLAENYIFLVKTRFGSDYDFKIIKNATIDDKFIPTGALQTLLENVVKHNKGNIKTTIVTTLIIEEEWVVIANMKSMQNSKTETLGTGLENLKTRYQWLSNQQIRVLENDEMFKVSIPIIKLYQKTD